MIDLKQNNVFLGKYKDYNDKKNFKYRYEPNIEMIIRFEYYYLHLNYNNIIQLI